ncbi:amidohydrolase [Nonomuraea sp. K274]|uniref:Amidohydrolase n=1 Tax=Nonomuraea cypriaca TaxID=1187855 RepID=A0A931EWL4_9ACTN|nr:amidohydrolase family protein [Nonomuraea cypriaca]MBF8184582.1 amidohydrolase [Nonomuraea cypriaca]
MPTIDLHAHLIDRAAIAILNGRFPELCPALSTGPDGYFLTYPGRPALGPVPASMFEVEARLADMDRDGIDRQVVAVPPPQLLYQLDSAAGATCARVQNEAAMEVSRLHPDRIHVFGTLPLQDPEAAVREVAHLAKERRVRGVQIGTNINGGNLDDPALDPVWATLSEAGLPVWVHPDQRTVAGADRLSSYYLVNLVGNPLESTIAMAALVFGGVLERHRALRFGFVHGGGFTPYQLGRWDHGWSRRSEPRRHIARTPSEYVERMYFDTLTHDDTALAFLGARVGWERVVLGSDHPFDMATPDPVAAVRRLGLPEREQAAVLGGNAARFLRAI